MNEWKGLSSWNKRFSLKFKHCFNGYISLCLWCSICIEHRTNLFCAAYYKNVHGNNKICGVQKCNNNHNGNENKNNENTDGNKNKIKWKWK